jgi:hypothetical protein
VTGHAQRLQVDRIKPRTTVLDWLYVVHDPGSHQQALGTTGATQRVLTQEGCPHQTPLAGLVEAHLGIEAAPRATVVAVDKWPMGRAVARLCKNRCTPRVSAWCRGATGHRKSLQKDAEHPQIRLGFLREQSVHTNTINDPRRSFK